MRDDLTALCLNQAKQRIAALEAELKRRDEQKPVAWMETGHLAGGIFKKQERCIGPRVPLYAAPVAASAEVPEDVLEVPAFLRRDDTTVPPAVNRGALALAYGYLWHVNNSRPGYDAPADNPRPQFSPEKAAMAARKVLRDMLTHEERGLGINGAMDMLAAAQQEAR